VGVLDAGWPPADDRELRETEPDRGWGGAVQLAAPGTGRPPVQQCRWLQSSLRA